MDKNYRIMFLRTANNHPVGCLAIKLDGNIVTYQVSTLNPVDQFNRRLARQLALGRLLEEPIPLTGSTEAFNATSVHNIIRHVMADVITNRTIPNRARHAAAKWLTKSRAAQEVTE